MFGPFPAVKPHAAAAFVLAAFAWVRLDNGLIFADGFEQEDTGP